MSWNIASAKQQFSEIVRLAAHEPQAICKRDKPVAVLISAGEFEGYQRLLAARRKPALQEQFAQIRAILTAEGSDGIQIAPRGNRPNPFDAP
ncbi:MAG: type II toxin-antitoxin system Phd/YefM family antitoxin [Burkholderiaceae bacterium]|jgi:prevent-host-death family protein|nr:type II toxin-antitoxin system Phd/YefM family antitoxin [Burkholderiaceae bacterium]